MFEEIKKELRVAFQTGLHRVNKVASGKTLRSIQVVEEVSRNEIKFRVTADEGARWIIEGRKASGRRPPIQPLKEWIRQRRLTINPYALQNALRYKDIPPSQWINVSVSILEDSGIGEKVGDAAFLTIDELITKAKI